MLINLKDEGYNPDVLCCLANLSNDEVFTPPEIANKMLDMLPQELFRDPNTTFLDPACKSGVFLREIARRLIVGLQPKIPDLQERLDHIFHKQLYGIAITQLTSLLSRRSLYCSKFPNSKYSVSYFNTPEGDIRFRKTQHKWKDGKCIFCGASQREYDRDSALETHAYEFIHISDPKEIFNMKFDVIISNPPYQLNTASDSAQATPLYDKFVLKSMKLQPKHLIMIIPSRWYAGGMGLDIFRKEMMSNHHIKTLVDYPNADECFNGVTIRGGVCYFHWDKDYNGNCYVGNIIGGVKTEMLRDLNEYPVFVRWNSALRIIKKIEKKNEHSLSELISSVSPFGLPTSERGEEKRFPKSIILHSSKGIGYISSDKVDGSNQYFKKYKVLLSRPISGNMETPPFKVIAMLEVLQPKEVCTHTYLVAGKFDSFDDADNLRTYLQTRFTRFLLALSISGMDISREKFRFVPLQDFSKPWTDKELYEKYNLSPEEIAFIESMIRPMS